MKYLKGALIVLLAIIGVGYKNFNANASGDLKKGIYYDNIDYTDNVAFNKVDGVNLDYSAELVKPGDYYELYFDVVNSTGYNVEITDCESVRVKYTVLYKEYIDKQDYTFDTSFSILYEQTI